MVRIAAVGALALVLAVAASTIASDSKPENSVFTDREVRIFQSMALSRLSSPPINPSNAVSDDPRAVEFGKALFFDPSLSGTGTLSCASCHQPDKAFADGLRLGEGAGVTDRNTPTLLGVGHLQWFYWDGRRDSLWAQALIPFEATSEMGGTRVTVVKAISDNEEYLDMYQALFGPFPDLNFGSLPNSASPIGEAEVQNRWYRLDSSKRQVINRVFSNIGKSIAAYERTLQPESSRFDRFVEALEKKGEREALSLMSESELLGARLFVDEQRTQCLQCHNGPLLSNGGFHNIGTGVFQGAAMDFGRVFGLQAALMDEFNCYGKYSDADRDECHHLNYLSKDPHQGLQGAFKVPTLRYLDQTAPYFHDGRFDTLAEVIDYYVSPPTEGRNAVHELRPLELSSKEKSALIAFLKLFSPSAKQ